MKKSNNAEDFTWHDIMYWDIIEKDTVFWCNDTYKVLHGMTCVPKYGAPLNAWCGWW